MKFLTVLLAVSLSAHAAPGDPGKVAIDFLEKVRLGKIDLEPGGDTALSPQTAAEKKRQIARRLERMARELGDAPLEIGAVKLDENFAGVLVRKTGGFDPGKLQVFPVALIKRGLEWTAAPVPASFENAGAGYAISLRKRMAILEDWMLREQVVDLEKLRAQSSERMRRRIEKSLTVAELRRMSSKQAGDSFLAACSRKDLAAILGLLGGLAAELPADWPARLRMAERAMDKGAEAPRLWRLVTASEVLRVGVDHEENGGSAKFVVACLDPGGSSPGVDLPRIEVIHLNILKSIEGLWRIDPPATFFLDSEEPPPNPEDGTDTGWIDSFSSRWMEMHPPAPEVSADFARKSFSRGLRSADPASLLALSKLDNPPPQARKACIQAAQFWRIFHDPTTVRHAVPLSFKEGNNTAIGLYQIFSARDPDQFDLQPIYFERSTVGWQWTPVPSTEIVLEFRKWVEGEAGRWPSKWQMTLLQETPVLKEIGTMGAPTPEVSRGVVTAWHEAVRNGDVEAALRLIARLDDDRSGSTVLQNLGYEILGSRRRDEAPSISGIYQGRTWTAVGVRIDRGGASAYPAYPVVQTALGPRILAEIDLFASGNRGRDFLNKTAFERLAKHTGNEVVTELQQLFTEHQENVRDLKK